MKSVLVTFFLFTAFAIVLAHGIIPHHHHDMLHVHKHGPADHDHDHSHHPQQEDHAQHHNIYSWFILAKKDPLNTTEYNDFSPGNINIILNVPTVIIEKLNLQSSCFNLYAHLSCYSNNHLRAPPPLTV